MRAPALLVVALGLCPGVRAGETPTASATYEALRDGTIQLGEAGDLGDAGEMADRFEPLFGDCVGNRGFATRRCEAVRAALVDKLQGARFVATGDASSLQSQPYDAAGKSLTLVVTGCVRCVAPPVIDGAPRLVVSRPTVRLDGVTATGVDLDTHDVPLADAAAAKKFALRTLPHLVVEYVFSSPTKVRMGDKDVVKVSILGHRVYDRCTGAIVASAPPSTEKTVPTALLDPRCAGQKSPEELAAEAAARALPTALTKDQIEDALAPTRDGVADCGANFELKGMAQVEIAIHGDGAAPTVTVLAPADAADAALCIRQAVRRAKFPRFKKDKMVVRVPFRLTP